MRAENEGDVRSFAWVLMPDHLHWILQLEAQPLGACMQRFKSRSARAVNQVIGNRGSLWQAGYYDHQIRGHDELIDQARYVLGNPVRKGLVARTADYPWWWCAWPLDSTGSPW